MDRKARPTNNYRRRESYESPDRNRQRPVRRSRTRSRSPHHPSSQRNTFRNPRGKRTSSRSPHSERQHQIVKETPTRKSHFTENSRTKNNLDENIVKKPLYRGPETIFKVDRDIEILVNPNKSSPTRSVSSPSRIVIARPKEGNSMSNSNSTDRHTYDSRRDHRDPKRPRSHYHSSNRDKIGKRNHNYNTKYPARRNDYDRRSPDRNPSPRRGRDYSRDSYDSRNRNRGVGETGRNYKNDYDRPERPRRISSRDRRRRERSHNDDSRTHSSLRRERDFSDDNRRKDRFNGRRRSEEERRNSDRSDTYDKYTEETHSSDKDDSHHANEEQLEQEENNAALTQNNAMHPGMYPYPLPRPFLARPPIIPVLPPRPRIPPPVFFYPRPGPILRPRIVFRGYFPPPRFLPYPQPRPITLASE